MWRSRARLGLCAIVVALAWPGVAVIAVAGVGTAPTRSACGLALRRFRPRPSAAHARLHRPASRATRRQLRLRSAAAPVLIVTCLDAARLDGIPPSPSDLACPNAACCAGVLPASSQIVVVMGLTVPTTLTLGIQATPPGSATRPPSPPPNSSDSRPARHPRRSSAAGHRRLSDRRPGDHGGRPSSVPAASSRTYTFTYKAGSCGAGPGGVVAVTVPAELDAAEHRSGAPGFVTWASSPPAVCVRTDDQVPAGNLEPGTRVTFEYEAAQDPGSPARTRSTPGSPAGGPTQHWPSPVVMVTPPW